MSKNVRYKLFNALDIYYQINFQKDVSIYNSNNIDSFQSMIIKNIFARRKMVTHFN